MCRLACALALLLLGCVERRVEPEFDVAQEVAEICENYCSMGLACIDEPLNDHDECVEICTAPGTLHEDSDCGEAFRSYFGCMGSTQSCEVWNVANESVCADEAATLWELECGSREDG